MKLEESDIEKLMKLFEDFGIGFKTGTTYKGYDLISCHQGDEKIDGYCGFLTTFEFDENGKFKEMGAWE
jgi:hypothetical protein